MEEVPEESARVSYRFDLKCFARKNSHFKKRGFLARLECSSPKLKPRLEVCSPEARAGECAR